MPAYKTFGKPLVYFAGYAKHVGLYATPSGHEAFAKELAHYKQGKGSVQFPHNQPLPEDLIRRIVAFRTKENFTNKHLYIPSIDTMEHFSNSNIKPDDYFSCDWADV